LLGSKVQYSFDMPSVSPSVSSSVAVAVIGCGNFARQVHLPNLALIPHAHLAAVCDVDEHVAAQAASRFGATHWYSDVHAVLADPQIQAVIIAVRDDLQSDLTKQALLAGKHVYVEKPLSADPAACKEVAAHVAPEVSCAIGYHKRFAAVYQKAKNIANRHGGIQTISLRMSDDAWRWAHGYPPGYLLQHDVCHFFDLLHWLTGSTTQAIHCISGRVEDDLMTVQLANGSAATIFASGNASMDLPKERCEIICEQGALIIDDYVELRAYGYVDEPKRQTVPLRFEHAPQAWQARAQAVNGIDDFTALRHELWRQFYDTGAAEVIPNFLRDQGWLNSLSAWCTGILSGQSTEHARADAYPSL
jgi:predicted dehydrogenase